MAEQIKNEEMETEADLTAASDSISKIESELPKLEYKVKLKHPVTWNDDTINEIDLSGLQDLTTLDAQEIDRTMARLNHAVGVNKLHDTLYCKHIAMRVTGKPADFFNTLKWSDMEEIKSRILIFFMFN